RQVFLTTLTLILSLSSRSKTVQRMRIIHKLTLALSYILLITLADNAVAQTWEPLKGLEGGAIWNVITRTDGHWTAFGSGWVYQSTDAGKHWISRSIFPD